MRKDNKYEKILMVSANLMSQKGFNGVSLQQVADKTKLHKSSLFHYITSKEELLLRILERAFDEVYENFQEIIRNNELDAGEKLSRAIDNHLTFLTDYRANTTIFLNELRCLSSKNQRMQFLVKIKRYEKDFEKIIMDMKREGYFHGLDPKVVAFGILGMVNWVNRWYRRDGPLTIKEISDMFCQMVVRK